MKGRCKNMTVTYDIFTDNGHRLLTCVRDSQGTFLRGKNGTLSVDSFLAQIANPSLARRMRKMRNR